MVEERAAHLERIGHAGAIDLGEDVVRQIRLEVDVLDARQRVGGVRGTVQIAEQLRRPMAFNARRVSAASSRFLSASFMPLTECRYASHGVRATLLRNALPRKTCGR
jgi:hypothetical protein